MNKKLLGALIAVGSIASAYYMFTTTVKADDFIRPNIVARIAQKFNLNEADVEAVFEAVRDEKQEERRKEKENKLSQAVKDGVITQNQKDTIIKMMQDNQVARFAHREEMQKWMADQGIDHTKLQNCLRSENRGEGRGKGMMGR